MRRRVVSTLTILPGWGLNLLTVAVVVDVLRLTLTGVLSAALMGQVVGYAFNTVMIDRWIYFIERYGGEYAATPSEAGER